LFLKEIINLKRFHMKLGNTGKVRTPLTPLATAIALALGAPMAFAEDEKAVEEDIEKIVVTGEFQQSLINRISVTPKELPFTLDVIDSDFLDARNFTRPIDALTTLPNIARGVDILGTGTSNFISRGFDAPILVDNRYQNDFRGMGARDDSFVERYEILKGPASISSGPVGAGGIINTVTKIPTAVSNTGIKLRVDQFGSAGADFDVNVGELNNSDTVLLRVSGAYRDVKFDADNAGLTTTAIRPVVIFNISSETSIKASAAYRDVKSNPNYGFPLTNEGEIPDIIDTDTFTGFVDGESNTKDTLYDIELNHQFLDNLKLTVRGSKQSTDNDYKHMGGIYSYDGLTTGDYTYISENAAKNKVEATFVDAQLAYQANFWGQTQDFVIGVANAKNDWTREFSENYSWEQLPLDQIGEPIYGWDDENYGDYYLFQSTNQKLKSIFAEAAIRPNEELTITAGIRYDDLEEDNFRGGPYGYSDSELTTRLGASYAISSDINVYASFAQAFVPQYRPKLDGTPTEAETSDGLEFGLKGSALNNRMSFQTALFSTIRKGVAITDRDNPDYVITIGETDVKGIEFSSVTMLTEALNLTFNIGYSDIDISDEDKTRDIDVPVYPNVTGSIYLDYEVLSGSLEGLTLSGGLRNVGESEGPKKTWDAYNIVDLNANYPVTENINVSIGVLNLTDEKYIENTSSPSVNSYHYGAVLGAPRTVTMTLRWDM
jgi:iron complex outermembrane receptor protein